MNEGSYIKKTIIFVAASEAGQYKERVKNVCFFVIICNREFFIYCTKVTSVITHYCEWERHR